MTFRDECFVGLPADGIYADGAGQAQFIIGRDVASFIGTPTHEAPDGCIVCARGQADERVLGDGHSRDICGNELGLEGRVDDVFFEDSGGMDCALAVRCDDERSTVVIVLEVVGKGSGNIAVGGV